MFIQLQCCQKCFLHKQYNHNQWVFHDHYCKLDQTIQRKCRLRTLKNAKLPVGVMNELGNYQFGENEQIQAIVDSQKERIRPEVGSFEIRFKGVYVFSIGESKQFPDYNLVAKLLLVIMKADVNEVILLNKEIKIAGLVSMYEFVKDKHQHISEQNIKLKSIQQLIPQKEFRRTLTSTSKQKRPTHHPNHPHLPQHSKPKKDHNSFQECLFKERPQNHYVFKLKDGSNNLVKPSTAQNLRSIDRGGEKMSGRGSGTNMPLPKISAEEMAAKKRQQKRIRCKKFSNTYSNMTKKSDIINKLVKSEYGRIKEEKYEFLSRDSDLAGDQQFSEDFELQELSDSSDQEQNIFRNCSNFSRISCIELLNQLCKAQQHPKKFQQQQNNLNQIQSTQSIQKKEPQNGNEFDYQYDSGQKLNEFDQIDFNINLHSMKDRIDYSSNNLLEPIREAEDEKWENNSFNSSGVNLKIVTEKNSVHVSRLREGKVEEKLQKLSRSKHNSNSLVESQVDQSPKQNQSMLKQPTQQSCAPQFKQNSYTSNNQHHNQLTSQQAICLQTQTYNQQNCQDEANNALTSPFQSSHICVSHSTNLQNNQDELVAVNTFSLQYSLQNSPLYDYFSSNLQNFTQKISSFNKVKSPGSQSLQFQQTNQVEHFFSSIYPCPKILLQTKNKKKISKIIQNFIDPYLEQLGQSQKEEKQWVELTQTNVCKIFLLKGEQSPKKVETIFWNRINPMETKLYITKPEDDIQTFIQIGQLHKEYHQVFFLFYHHTFELHRLTFETISRKLAISQNEKGQRKYSFELNIGEKHQPQSEEAKNEPNHIFVAFEAKPNSEQVRQKLKSLNLVTQNEPQTKIQVYQKQKNQQPNGQGLIGTIEKKGKFFFELNLQKGSYKFDITMKNVNFKVESGGRQVEMLFYSEAKVRTSKVKELFE